MSDTNEITNIQIKKTTRDLIDSLCQPGESYDEIIQKLAQFYMDNHGNLMDLPFPGTSDQ
jgi:hypothetical protein